MEYLFGVDAWPKTDGGAPDTHEVYDLKGSWIDRHAA